MLVAEAVALVLVAVVIVTRRLGLATAFIRHGVVSFDQAWRTSQREGLVVISFLPRNQYFVI